MRQGFTDIEESMESMESIELWFTSVAEEAAGARQAGSKAFRRTGADYSADLFVIELKSP